MISKDEVLRRIRYSSNWNQPCPEWVYNLILNMPDEEPEQETDSEEQHDSNNNN